MSLSLIIHIISSRRHGESPRHTRSTLMHVQSDSFVPVTCVFVGACALCASPPACIQRSGLAGGGGSGEAQNVTLSEKKKEGLSERGAEKSPEKSGRRKTGELEATSECKSAD